MKKNQQKYKYIYVYTYYERKGIKKNKNKIDKFCARYTTTYRHPKHVHFV